MKNYFRVSFDLPQSLSAPAIRELLRRDEIRYRAVTVDGGVASIDIFELAAATRIERALRSHTTLNLQPFEP